MGSQFESYLYRACGPLMVRVGDRTWSVRSPRSAGVVQLDAAPSALFAVAGLLGEECGADILTALRPARWSTVVGLEVALRGHFHLVRLPTGTWSTVVQQIDRYGAEIDFDLMDRGHDLLDWFRGLRPWPQLLGFVERLPPGSCYQAAVSDDDDLARIRLERGMTAGRATTPGLVGDTREVQLLRQVLNGVRRIPHAVLAAQHGRKAGRAPKDVPEPETAEQRLEMEFARHTVEDIFRQAAPKHYQSSTAGQGGADRPANYRAVGDDLLPDDGDGQ